MKSVKINDANGKKIEVEVTEEVFQYLLDSAKEEERRGRSDRRRLERQEMTDALLVARMLYAPQSIEELCESRDHVSRIFSVLRSCTEIQKRRFLLYYLYGYNYVEIASIEKRDATVVHRSIQAIQKKIKKFLEG